MEREGEQQAAMQQQPQQGEQQPQQGQQQPQQTEQQAATQAQQGQAGFTADVQAVEGEETEAEVARMTPEDTSRLLAADETAATIQSQPTEFAVADLEGRDVHTLRGEDVGDIEGFATAGGQLYAIIAHGGFLGIGEDQIAVPAERIAVRGDEVVLLGLTEEQLEQMPEYDFNTDQEVVGSDVVQIGRYE